jgi:sugar lactone lactonase YvrE
MKIELSDVSDYGHDLNRPECVLCLASGDLFVSHKGAGVTHIAPDGRQRIIGRTGAVGGHELVPNGIALMPDGSFLIANIGEAGGVWRLQADGTIEPHLLEVDGERLAAANFVTNDDQGRVWITVSTRKQPRYLAYSADVADGFVVLADGRGARIVADGCVFTNEMRLAADGSSVYVSETFARRISRFVVRDDGTLGPRQDFATFGYGTFPDGIAFDEQGYLWVTSIVSNRLIRVAPNGISEVVLEDSVAEHVDAVEQALAEGRMGREHFYTIKSRKLRNIASITFGGPDRRTVYLGSLVGTTLATLRSPVPGRTPVHWNYRL